MAVGRGVCDRDRRGVSISELLRERVEGEDLCPRSALVIECALFKNDEMVDGVDEPEDDDGR